LFIRDTFIFIDTFLGCPTVPQTRIGTLAGTITTYSRMVTCFGARFRRTTCKSVAHPWLIADALLGRGIAHCFAGRVDVTVCTWIGWNWNTFSVVDTFISFATVGNGAFVFYFTNSVDSNPSGCADTVALFDSINARIVNIGHLARGTCDTVTWIDHFFANKPVAGEPGLALAVVICFCDDGVVRHTVGVDVTIVVAAWVDLVTNEPTSKPPFVAFALVVYFIPDNL